MHNKISSEEIRLSGRQQNRRRLETNNFKSERRACNAISWLWKNEYTQGQGFAL